MTLSPSLVRPVAAQSLQFDPEVLQFWADEARTQRAAFDTVAAYLG
ncbi:MULTISPECIES: hypothetical protein [Halomonadaceae]|uniref:Uncharacterized protein n=1 Tax=Modicisalibacter zincidurans TaxID=1178777 RepID=A0ABP9R131_9GAMM|nr:MULTISPECIES: hypothetical protein [Halomonas]MCD6007470.1 hypothetical protein [Halomonas sp. IOP_31]